MPNPAALAVIRQSPIFKGLSTDTLEAVCALAVNHRYQPGDAVFREGEAGTTLYGVVSGQLHITTTSSDGRDLLLNVIEPGEIVGEIAFLDGGERTATGRAAIPSTCFAIPRDPFFALMSGNAPLAVHLLQLVCQRVRWTSRLVADSAFLSVPERLAARLTDLVQAQNHQDIASPTLRISQTELATFLGVSRQVVNRYLREWHQQGHVALSRGRITINNLEAIQV